MSEQDSDETALLRAVHASRGDATPRLIYADWLDDTGRPQEAAMHRYIADPSDRHRDLFVGQHGGDASRAAHQLSQHIYDRSSALAPVVQRYSAFNPAGMAHRASLHAGEAVVATTPGIKRDSHYRASTTYASEAGWFETLPARHNLSSGAATAAAELHAVNTAGNQLHRYAHAQLGGRA